YQPSQLEQEHGGGMTKDLTKNRKVVMPSWTEDEEIKELKQSYSRNKVRTTKYTFLSFIPKNLFEQLHRFANVYFIFLGALNFVPIVNAFQPEISIIPIVFVMSITAVKDLWEDQRRRKSDQQVNNLLCDVFDRKQKRYVERRWADVCVGDLIRLCCNEIIPADMVLLHSSDPNGVCHIETANLDGETNLKQRQVVRDLPQGSEFVPENYSSRIECENPNNDLRRFRGFMEHPGKVRVGLHSENLLLRSCTVRNTETVIGIVVYAGHETKAMQNNSGPRYKRSKLECRLNMDVLWCVVLLLLMCLVAAVGHGFWLSELHNPIFMIPDDTHPALAAFYMFWTMIIVLQVLIPISLYVSIEIVKLGQVYFIQNDLDLYNPVLDTGVQCRALNITEDLGQIQYLFSDKTGTLTENRMLFRRCTVAGTEYPHHENGPPRHTPQTHTWSLHQHHGEKRTDLSSTFTECAVVPDPQLQAKLNTLSSPMRSPFRQEAAEISHILDFFLALTVCNTVVVSSPTQPRHVTLQSPTIPSGTPSDTPPAPVTPALSSGAWGEDRDDIQKAKDNSAESESDDEDEAEELLYEAESPDEAALVQAAKAYGYTLLGRSPEQVLVAVPGTGPLSIALLHVLPFHSARKRMSVVVRHPLTGEVVVYTKGADNVIMDIKLPSEDGFSREIMERTQRHLDQYAREGLRTLCVAKKVLEEQEYKAWLKRHEYAETSIENREELLLESAERLETNLTLLGASGIVDRLQEEVPETIEALQEAGIKVWVLTGDKQETAINIAFACKLIRPTDHILMANCDSKETCEARLQELQHEIRQVTKEGTPEDDSSDSVLVIDGRTLDYALQKELQGSFLDLTCCCRSVICCRSTPLQKSQVVQLVRDKLKVMTLAIGDGANDVSMIQMADVGIGISGQEGMQAVMSSDFAISRFKFLRKLILVHGHWCYARLANMILYFFYKNVMYVNLLFWYQFFCGFSGSTMTNSWVLIFFNLLFTSVPPIIYGVLDKDVSGEMLLEVPDLYKYGQNSEAYLPSTFWLNILDAFYQSLVCFFIPYFAYAGSDIGVFFFGSPINGSALLIILLHQLIESRTVVSQSQLFFLIYNAVIMCVTCNSPTNPYGIETKVMSEPLYYLICGFTTVLALLPRYYTHISESAHLHTSNAAYILHSEGRNLHAQNFILFLCHRILVRAFCNTICPSDLVRAQKMERLSAQDYSMSLRQWKENKAAQRLSSRHVPQNFSVNADMPHLTDCIAEAGTVLS
uniref:Phospholipid-transporting ATPase n=1 Tax=Cyprinus carpio TaxID=7962 RepID=A0A8C1RJH6_CYPCA